MFRNENIPTLSKAILSFNPCNLVQKYVGCYCNVDFQSSSLKAKSLEQHGFSLKHGFEFSYSLNSSVHLLAWRLKDINVTLMSFLCLCTETITPERKSFFSKLHDKCCQN